jgi:hypothetical protein
MGQVIHLATEGAVDAAWTAYVEKAVLLAANPGLLCDRQFNEDLTRRHERWRRLFMLQEAAK